MNDQTNTDPHQIRARVEAALAELPRVDPEAGDLEVVDVDPRSAGGVVGVIDEVGRRLEEAHQMLVDALESVEKG